MNSLMRLVVLTALVGVWATPTAWAQWPFADLQGVFPPGCQVGESCEVTLTGSDLDGPQRLVFSHPGIKAEPVMRDPRPWEDGQQAVENRFTVAVDKKVPPGYYEARVEGLFGLSTPRTFVVGTLPELLEASDNTSADNAQEIALGSVVNGQAPNRGFDYFRFEAKKGQRVLIELEGERIDSQVDGVLVLFDPQGRELGRANRVDRRDPMLDVSIAHEGWHTIQLNDLVFSGGASHPYRLKVHTGPRIDYVFPPAGVPGEKSKFTLFGRNLPGGKPTDITLNGRPLEKLEVEVNVPKGRATRELDGVGYRTPEEGFQDAFAYRLNGPNGTVSNAVAIGYCDEPLIVETADNNTPETAMPLEVPCEVAGQFYPAGDVDWYRFEAKQGEEYSIEVLSHRLGRPTDPILFVQQVTTKEDGTVEVRDLQTQDDTNAPDLRLAFDTSHRDPIWRLKAPADATYRVMVRDLAGYGDRPQNVYRLRIAKPEPDYRLVAVPRNPLDPTAQNKFDSQAAVVRRGGTTWLDVLIDRRDGFDAPVTLRVEGLPKDLSSAPVILGPNVNWTTLVIAASEDAAPWSGEVEVIGTAEVAGKSMERHARGGSVIWPGVQNRTVGQSRVTERIMLSVTSAEVAPFRVEIDTSEMFETSRAGVLKVPVRVVRRGEFKQDVALAGQAVPKDWEAKNLQIKKDDSTAEFEFAPKPTAPVGIHTVYLEAQGKDNYQRNPAAAEEAQEHAKAADEYLKEMTTAEAEAKKRKDEADKAVQTAQKALQDAERALKAAQDQKEKNPEDEEAAKKADEAAAALEEAQKTQAEAQEEQQQSTQALTEATATKQQADTWKKEVDARTKQLTDAAKAKQLTFYEATDPITIHVREVPVEVKLDSPSDAVAAGGKLEVPVAIERLFDFADEVSFEVKVPSGAKLKADRPKVEKDKSDGMLTFEVAEDATPGVYDLEVEASLRFNNQNLKSSFPLQISVAPQS